MLDMQRESRMAGRRGMGLCTRGSPRCLLGPAIGLFICLSSLASAIGADMEHTGPRAEPPNGKYRIAIHCSARVLELWAGTTLLRDYPVETGRRRPGKRRSGDHRTPLGDYVITWMASAKGGKGYRIVGGTSWCKDNRFVRAQTGPPLEKLWSLAYGGRHAYVMSINYPNDWDRAKGRTGNCIHIHATGRLEDGALSQSYGCIHMFPKDAAELYQLVQVGTPVKILP